MATAEVGLTTDQLKAMMSETGGDSTGSTGSSAPSDGAMTTDQLKASMGSTENKDWAAENAKKDGVKLPEPTQVKMKPEWVSPRAKSEKVSDVERQWEAPTDQNQSLTGKVLQGANRAAWELEKGALEFPGKVVDATIGNAPGGTLADLAADTFKGIAHQVAVPTYAALGKGAEAAAHAFGAKDFAALRGYQKEFGEDPGYYLTNLLALTYPGFKEGMLDKAGAKPNMAPQADYLGENLMARRKGTKPIRSDLPPETKPAFVGEAGNAKLATENNRQLPPVVTDVGGAGRSWMSEADKAAELAKRARESTAIAERDYYRTSPKGSSVTGKVARDSADVFNQELDTPKVAEESARVITRDIQRGDNPLERPASVNFSQPRETPSGEAGNATLATNPRGVSPEALEGVKPQEAEVPAFIKRVQDAIRVPQHILDLRAKINEQRTQANLPPIPEPPAPESSSFSPEFAAHIAELQKNPTLPGAQGFELVEPNRPTVIRRGEPSYPPGKSYVAGEEQPNVQIQVRRKDGFLQTLPHVGEAEHYMLREAENDMIAADRPQTISKVKAPGQGGGSEYSRMGSGMPDWFQELDTSTKQVQGALEAVKTGKILTEQQARIVDHVLESKRDSWEKQYGWHGESGAVDIQGFADLAKELKGKAVEMGLELPKESQRWIDRAIQEDTNWKARSKKAMTEKINIGLMKGIKPSVEKMRDARQRASYKRNFSNAVEKLVELKNELPIRDENGEIIYDAETGKPVTGKLQKTVMGMANAIYDAKKLMFDKYNSRKEAAGEKGATIKPDRIISELDKKIIQNRATQRWAPRVIREAKRIVKDYSEGGDLTVPEAQDELQQLNSNIKSFIEQRDPSQASTARAQALAAVVLRDLIDETITKTEGEGYAEERRQYGSLKHIEDDVNHRATVMARANSKGLTDLFDIYSTPDLILSAAHATAHPAGLVRSVMMRGVKEWRKWGNNPDHLVSAMFKSVDKANRTTEGRFGKEASLRSAVGTGRNAVAAGAPGEAGRGDSQRRRWNDINSEYGKSHPGDYAVGETITDERTGITYKKEPDGWHPQQ